MHLNRYIYLDNGKYVLLLFTCLGPLPLHVWLWPSVWSMYPSGHGSQGLAGSRDEELHLSLKQLNLNFSQKFGLISQKPPSYIVSKQSHLTRPLTATIRNMKRVHTKYKYSIQTKQYYYNLHRALLVKFNFYID